MATDKKTAGALLAALLILAVGCLPAPPAHAETNFARKSKETVALPPLSPPDQAFPLGEKLVYDISWVGIPIGTGELWAKEKTSLAGREVYHIVGVIETNKFLSTIFPVHDEIHSWIDVATLRSVRFEKKISEGSKKINEKMVFETPTHDVLSAFYWVRRQMLTPGESAKTVVRADRKEWALEVVVMRRELITVRGRGTFDTLLVEPRSRVAGRPEQKGKSLIHLSADSSRKPVKLTYKAPFGRIMGILRKRTP